MFAIGTLALWLGKINGDNWVYLCLVVLGGHNAQDIVSAYRNR